MAGGRRGRHDGKVRREGGKGGGEDVFRFDELVVYSSCVPPAVRFVKINQVHVDSRRWW